MSKRVKVFKLRLSESDMSALQDAAEKREMNASELIRRLLIQAGVLGVDVEKSTGVA